MAKPYKLTPIGLALLAKGHFEDNLNKFINNETMANGEKMLMLQEALQQVYRSKPHRKKPLKVNFIDRVPPQNFERSTSSEPPPEKEEDPLLFKVLISVADLFP